jgi:hypothetical protein
VHGLLGMNGYARTKIELFFDWTNFEPPVPGECPVEADVRVERRPGDATRCNLSVSAFAGDKLIGTCVCRSGGESARDLGAQDWIFTNWLWVDADTFTPQSAPSRKTTARSCSTAT